MIPSPNMTFLLAPGDRMELDEFLERWEQSPELKFAELIDGVVYMPSPVSFSHTDFEGLAASLLGHYRLCSGICKVFPNATWLMGRNAPQPDQALCLKPEYGGRIELIGNLLSGAPDLAVEVCRSSHSYDLGPKLALYQRTGIPEYLAILIEERRVEWRILRKGRYQFLKAQDGIFKSRVFPGLWIDEPAFWNGDEARLMAAVDEGLRSPEFLKFKARKPG